MKSIKPGRGPSKLSTVGSICVAIFGVFWCIMAGAMGAWFMIPFGLIFVGVGFKLKISQAALAKGLGVSVPTISRWERGSQEPHIMALGSFYDFCEKHEINFEEANLKCLEKH